MADYAVIKARKGISGSTLKIIAVSTMFIDHIGAVFLGAYPVPYYICRLIGRIAFPIFCFLLVEGFLHTKNLQKYMLRLALFALLSEIPFDLAFRRIPFDWESQNVFFTLLIGLSTIQAVRRLENILQKKPGLLLLCKTAAELSGAAIAWYLKTDYGAIGIFCIVLLYEERSRRTLAIALSCALLCCLSILEAGAFAAAPLVSFYNGERGISLKYVFYLFYPMHLLLLFFLWKYLT